MSIFTIIDIGTSKIAILKGGLRDNNFEIQFMREYPSSGIKRGKVIDMEALTSSIRRAIEDGERNLNEKIRKASICYSGVNIKGIYSTGTTRVKRKTITEEDINFAIEAATALNLPSDVEVLHVIPVEFIVDGNNEIRDPLGMKGTRLEAKVYTVTADLNHIENLITCANRAGIDVEDLILQAIASSEAVLSVHDKEIGTLVVDIGSGTTDISLFFDGKLRYINSLGIGGNQITNDLLIGLKTSHSEAERIKKQCGVLIPKTSSFYLSDQNRQAQSFQNLNEESKSSEIEIIGFDRQPLRVPLSIIREIIYARVEEILELIKGEIEKVDADITISSVIFTGGTSMMKGFTQLAESYLSVPSRVGKSGIGIVSLLNEFGIDERLIYEQDEQLEKIYSPEYCSAVGALIYKIKGESYSEGSGNRKNLFERISKWFRELIGK